MQTVGKILTHASTQLNDQRPGRAFTRWGRGLILDYLNLGLIEIATYRPEAFTEDKILELVPGATQSVALRTSLASISANEDGTPIIEGDIDMATAFNAYSDCKNVGLRWDNGTPKFHVRTYSTDRTNTHKFYVDPPVPAGVSVKVKASILNDTPEYTLADWDVAVNMSPKFIPNLIDYIMSRAYGLDRESVESRRQSESLLNKFYTSMGVKYKREAQFRSGYYNGKTGTGDPQASNR